ncbi:hypothetical protein GGU11DRAFT_784590 [Lentinula aff. detonsa]|nr:hypothetical protein GGU11DRAFT_784590 [Lentinula aff. detonsa]
MIAFYPSTMVGRPVRPPVRVDELSGSPPVTIPPLQPFITSPEILSYKLHAWSLCSNPRAHENLWLVVYEETIRDLLRPAQGQQQRIVASQQPLWHGQFRMDPKRRSRPAKGADSESETEPEENDEDNGSDSDIGDREEVGQDIAGQDEDDASSGRDSDTDSVAISEGTVSAERGKYKEKIPDVTTIVIRSEPANPPVALTRNWTDPGEKDLRRAKAVFTYMGGMNMLGCEADSYTELKRAPRHFRAKRRFDNDDADIAFYADLETQLYKAALQMADYAAIFFKKYPNSAEFLAIIGSGPFWRYAVVNRTDCPWPEPGQRLTKREKITKMDTFLSLFGSEYFEIGTQRSDAE